MDRREFLATLGGAAGVGWLSACASRTPVAAPASAPQGSGVPHTAVWLGGRFAGWAGARSPAAVATRGITDYAVGSPPPPPPRAPERFRDLVLDAPAGMAPAFYAWAATCLASGAEMLQRGRLVSVDAGGHAIAGIIWQGYVDELGFPALDRANCAAARLHVQAAVEHAGAGPLTLGQLPPATAPSWRCCDFALRLSALGEVGGQVQTISAFTCRRTRRRAANGKGWAMQPPVYSPLLVTLAAPAPAALADWAHSTVSQTVQLRYGTAAYQTGVGLDLTVAPQLMGGREIALRVLRASWLG